MIIQNPILQKSLIHHFALSEIATRVSSGQKVLDHETELLGTPTSISFSEDAYSRSDQVTVFNGTTSVIAFLSLLNDLTGNLTMAFVINITDWGENDNGRLIDTGNLKVYVDGASDANRIRVTRNNSTYADSSDDLSVGEEIEIIITSTSAGVTNIYIDTDVHQFALSGDADQAAGSPGATTNLYIGNDSAGANCFDGYMRDILIWNRILPASERQLVNDSLF